MFNIDFGPQGKELLGERRPAISPRAVVAPEFLEQTVPLRAAWVGTLKDKRYISAAIRHLARVLPGMSHLKRCSGKRLVLAFAAPISVDNSSPPALSTVGNSSHPQPQELEGLLGSEDFEPSNFEGNFEIVRVPASAPRTKAQACAASKIWPLNFHPDPYVERTLSGSCFTPEDLGRIDRCVVVCIEAARREARGNEDCTGSAIILDPRRGKIVAIAASRVDLHPMWHAAILAVDLVARLQGGGVYDLVADFAERRKRKYTGSRPEVRLPVAFPPGLLELARRERDSTSGREVEETGSRTETPLPAGLPELARSEDAATSGREVEEIGSRTEIQLPAGLLELTRHEEAATSGCEVKELKGHERGKNGASEYLCTNYWAFLLREPCPLCAMALVHSRVSDIFWGAENDRRGVLGSKALLHAVPGLNHRYRVWRGVREEECRRVCAEIIMRR